jgi:hypothetical protein
MVDREQKAFKRGDEGPLSKRNISKIMRYTSGIPPRQTA